MGKRSKKPVVRSDATAVEIYNEGLCVYLYDETQAEEIKRLIASGKYGATKSDETFHANLSVSKFGKHIAQYGLALSYELQQDDEISLEIAVGDALSEEELSVARWLDPQTAYLHIPG